MAVAAGLRAERLWTARPVAIGPVTAGLATERSVASGRSPNGRSPPGLGPNGFGRAVQDSGPSSAYAIRPEAACTCRVGRDARRPDASSCCADRARWSPRGRSSSSRGAEGLLPRSDGAGTRCRCRRRAGRAFRETRPFRALRARAVPSIPSSALRGTCAPSLRRALPSLAPESPTACRQRTISAAPRGSSP